MTNIPEPPDATHVLWLDFNNDLSLIFSVNGPFAPWPHPAKANIVIAPGEMFYENIYTLFESAGIAVPEPLYLENIDFMQQIWDSEQPVETRLIMEVDAIYLINEKTDE